MDVNLAHLLVWYLVFVFSTTWHECAHALVAFKGGDPTAYEGGQLSLDPIPHIRRSPFGMVLVPLITYVQAHWMIGWASAPYDPRWGERHPKRQALMSLAGPASNFLLAAAALIAIRVLAATGTFHLLHPQLQTFQQLAVVAGDPSGQSVLSAVAMALSIMASLNVLLGVFNLLPIPPLDGAGVVEGLAPGPVARVYERLREQPLAYLLGLVLAFYYFFPYIGGPAWQLAMALALG